MEHAKFEAGIADKLAEKLEILEDKIQAFDKWLSVGTPFESAQFERKQIQKEFRKTFGIVVQKDGEET